MTEPRWCEHCERTTAHEDRTCCWCGQDDPPEPCRICGATEFEEYLSEMCESCSHQLTDFVNEALKGVQVALDACTGDDALSVGRRDLLLSTLRRMSEEE